MSHPPLKPPQTERLRFRKPMPSDAPFILKLMNEPGYRRFIGDRNITSVRDAKHFIQERMLPVFFDHGFGMWLVELQNEGIPIGVCGLNQRDWFNAPDLGYALLSGFEGYGYAREACASVVRHAMKTLLHPVLYAITLPGNHRSVRVLEASGFTYQREIEKAPDGEIVALYQAMLKN